MKQKSNVLLLIGALAFLLGAALVLGTMRSGDHSKSASPASTVLVAKQAIPAGTPGETVLSQHLVEARQINAKQRVGDALSTNADLNGRMIQVAVAPGEQLRASQLRPPSLRGTTIEIPSGMQGVAVQLPFVSGGAGYVAAGDHVNVYGNVKDADGNATTKLVLNNVQVLDVSTEVAPRVSGNEERAGGSNVTYLLALNPDQAERVIFLAANEQVWLALTGNDAGAVPPTSGRRASDVLQ